MKALSFLLLLSVSFATAEEVRIPNRLIDYPGFKQAVDEAEPLREARRLTEEQFLQKMQAPGVVLLDARSAEKFKLRHIRGAVNLSLPDFTADELKKIIPSFDTPVLIYCNNNFEDSLVSFAPKGPSTSLNLATFVTLHAYGYRNVFELGPLLKVRTTKLPFAGQETQSR